MSLKSARAGGGRFRPDAKADSADARSRSRPSRWWAPRWTETFCLKKIEELQPNVVTLDLQMPGMNGIDTLKEIMRRQPLPVIVVSSHSTEGASITFKALGLGAFDFVAKPQDATAHMADAARELIAKIKAAADCKVVRPGTLRRPQRGRKRLGRQSQYPQPRKRWPSESPPEDRKPSNSCCRSFRQIFRERFWWCNTCRRALPICLRVGSTSCAVCG